MSNPRPQADTIAAVATAGGRGGIGIVRVSGAGARAVAAAVVGQVPESRRARHAKFRDARGEAIDDGLALFFPAPASYTGEDVLELHGHGGPVVLRMVLQRCLELGARLAQPGEFSQRAFLNGRLDLAQAEAVADLIDAATEAAARGAMRSLSGRFSAEVQVLVSGLTALRALVEATLDFPDEEVDFLQAADARGQLDRLRGELARLRERARQGSLLRSGLHVVLVGQPNVGKSSLLNQLAGEERAIVTDVAGTTRDALREIIQVEGIALHVIDTAGLRDSDDAVERLGIARTWQEIERADVVLVISDARSGVGAAELDILGRLPAGATRIHVLNKIDLAGRAGAVDRTAGEVSVWLSARSGEGVDLLRGELLAAAGWHPQGEDVYLARERHLEALARAAQCVERAVGLEQSLDLFAEELRLAQLALSAITGEVTGDDLLGEIFSRFCIGK